MTEINKQPTTEAGRSMVEMLGVLAIIGVLSIGGIAGYTHAMNKSKANDILDGVSKRAVVVSQQLIMGNETPSLVEYAGQQIGDCSVTLSENDYGNGFFGIQVSGIEQSVCERLQGQGLANASDIYLGDAYFDEATCAEGNGNVLTYVFNDSLNADAVAGGGAGAGASCSEDEKVSVTYTAGSCCNETRTAKFCPGDEPSACVPDAGCACDDGYGWADEDCCDELGGSLASDRWKNYNICCVSGEAVCATDASPDTGCICIQDGYSHDCGECSCISCSPEEGSALCSKLDSCVCVPTGYSSDCTESRCITCSPEEGVALCDADSESYNACICIPNGHTGDCSSEECIVCSEKQGTALCSDYLACICVPPGYKSKCNKEQCVACPSEQTATCDGDWGECTCQ